MKLSCVEIDGCVHMNFLFLDFAARKKNIFSRPVGYCKLQAQFSIVSKACDSVL